MNQLPPTEERSSRRRFGQVLCWMGMHDYRVISVTGSFGIGGGVENLRQRRLKRNGDEKTEADKRWVPCLDE